jgi:nucleotide-binding universal stress UspA family protein
MRRIRSIVVGIDFASGSAAALDEALRLEARDDAALHAVHVIDPIAELNLEQSYSDMAMLTKYLPTRDELSSQVREVWQVFCPQRPDRRQPQLDISFGHPIPSIVREVESHQADLLVLGTHGASGVELVTGSLATACVRAAPCDVLLVRSTHRGAYRRVLACVDFSDHSRKALKAAANAASRDGASLHVVHVFTPPWGLASFLPFRGRMDEGAERAQRDALHERLVAFTAPVCREVDPALQPHCDVVEHALSHGRGVQAHAGAIDADLVVVGTRGCGNLRYMLLGSTAERVVRNTPCSVLAVCPDRDPADTVAG